MGNRLSVINNSYKGRRISINPLSEPNRSLSLVTCVNRQTPLDAGWEYSRMECWTCYMGNNYPVGATPLPHLEYSIYKWLISTIIHWASQTWFPIYLAYWIAALFFLPFWLKTWKTTQCVLQCCMLAQWVYHELLAELEPRTASERLQQAEIWKFRW